VICFSYHRSCPSTFQKKNKTGNFWRGHRGGQIRGNNRTGIFEKGIKIGKMSDVGRDKENL
jgi:hypothetical protein